MGQLGHHRQLHEEVERGDRPAHERRQLRLFRDDGHSRFAGPRFTPKDDAKAQKVAVVSAGFAKRYFGDGVAVGHRIGMGSDPGTPTDIEIVGVAGDTRYESLRDEIPPDGLPLQRANTWRRGGQVVYVRTERDPANAFAVDPRGCARDRTQPPGSVDDRRSSSNSTNRWSPSA